METAPLSAARVKLIRSLDLKKFRDATGLFVVEGEKMVQEAEASSFRVADIYRTAQIGEAAMRRISHLSSPSPALALVHKPDAVALDGDRLAGALGAAGLYLALDGIKDPGNLGTMLRIADWFGLDGVFASPDTVDFFNPKVVQATMGAIFRVRFNTCDIPALCRAARCAGGHAYGTFLDGEDLYRLPALSTGDAAPVVLVVGNESRGIGEAVSAQVDARLFIPPFPAGRSGSESLNAAVAASLAIAEFRRRSR